MTHYTESTSHVMASLNNLTCETHYIAAQPHNDFPIGVDLPDSFGIRDIDSHYEAVIVANHQAGGKSRLLGGCEHKDTSVLCVATGLTRESAVINVYCELAKRKALADLAMVEQIES